MGKLGGYILQWVVIPVVVGVVGFYVLGPKFGGSQDDKSIDKSTITEPMKDDTTVQPDISDATSGQAKPVADTTPAGTSDSTTTKFDPDVPVNSGDAGSTTAKAQPADTALPADTADATVVKAISKPKVAHKRRVVDPNAPVDPNADPTTATTAPPKRHVVNPEEGPGDDVKKAQHKPKKEADPAKGGDPAGLPTTPIGDGGGNGTGTDGG